MITRDRIEDVILAGSVAVVAGALFVGAASAGHAATAVFDDPLPEPTAVTEEPMINHLDPKMMGLAAKKAKQIEIAAEKRARQRAQRSSGPMFTPTTNYNYSARFGQAGSSWSSGHHTGLDFAAPTGTPVFSALAGKVVEAGWGGAYGNHVIVRHDNGIETLYAHLNSSGVNVGDKVLRGQKIGTVGSTGNSSGPHLHFEVLKNDTQRDPMAFL